MWSTSCPDCGTPLPWKGRISDRSLKRLIHCDACHAQLRLDPKWRVVSLCIAVVMFLVALLVASTWLASRKVARVFPMLLVLSFYLSSHTFGRVMIVTHGEGRCATCGYDLRGTIAGRCSECGHAREV